MPEFSNDHENLIARLLGLFPLERVKKEYDVSGTSGKVYAEVAKNNSLKDVTEDVFRLFGHAKQHCYFFKHSEGDLRQFKTPFFNQTVHSENIFKQEKQLLVVEYLLILNYEFWEINNRTADKKRLRYYWPVKVTMRPDVLEIRFVIMEKNMRSSDRFVYVGRDVDEEMLLQMAIQAVPSARFDQRVDLNKGIKSLWADDEVDATEVAHKSKASVDRAVMDAGLTYKQTYPERYKEIVRHPLKRMMFYTLKNKEWPYIFNIDPTDGYLGCFRFTDDGAGVDDLMEELMKRNA